MWLLGEKQSEQENERARERLAGEKETEKTAISYNLTYI